MKFEYTFSASAGDYFGYVSPQNMMRQINEGVAIANYEDGVGFSHIFDSVGVTWMLGQCVLEYKRFVPCAEPVEVETGGHEHFGPTVLRRSVMRFQGEDAMVYTAKSLPVHFKQRKVADAKVLEPFWKTPPAPAGENISFIVPPGEMVSKELFAVHYRDCDINKHMTAFKYMDLTMDTIGYWDDEPRLPLRIQIDFLRECTCGDMLDLRYGFRDGVHYCTGVKQDGTVSFNASVRLSEETYPAAKIIRV